MKGLRPRSRVEALHLRELEALDLTLELSRIVCVVHLQKILHELGHTRTAINVGRVTILSMNVSSLQIYKRYLKSPAASCCEKVRRISLCSLGVAHPFPQAVNAALELDAGGILLHVCPRVIVRYITRTSPWVCFPEAFLKHFWLKYIVNSILYPFLFLSFSLALGIREDGRDVSLSLWVS